jgi:outer membrane protein assembly factor BamB
MIYYDGLLYMATERGIASAMHAETGETVWRERLGDVYHASPVAAEGRVYLLGESGDTVVLHAGRAPEILSRNALGERTLASPALSLRQIFIRGDEHLFAIARNAEEDPLLGPVEASENESPINSDSTGRTH